MNDRAQNHLQDTRSATREAESALLAMQSHQPLPEKIAINDGGLSFQKLPDSSGLPGMTWIEVRATVHSRTASVVGLVPQDTIPAGAK